MTAGNPEGVGEGNPGVGARVTAGNPEGVGAGNPGVGAGAGDAGVGGGSYGKEPWEGNFST